LLAAEQPPVQAAAAKGMTDLFLSLGPFAVESVLVAATEGSANERADGDDADGDGADGDGADGIGWRPADGRGVLQLLTAAVRGVLERVERAAAKPASSRCVLLVG